MVGYHVEQWLPAQGSEPPTGVTSLSLNAVFVANMLGKTKSVKLSSHKWTTLRKTGKLDFSTLEFKDDLRA